MLEVKINGGKVTKINDICNYEDDKNNKIIINGKVKYSPQMNITFTECNAYIEISDGVNLTDCDITLGKNSRLTIGSGSTIKGRVSIGAFSSITIGEQLSVTSNLYMRVVESTSLIIGRDCLVASDVIIRTNDGHPIYDTNSKCRINQSKNIVIEDHVWIGDQVAVLKGVTIGRGSIIAMRSVVTKDIPEKCVAAGIPATVVRHNTTWEHNSSNHSPEYYD